MGYFSLLLLKYFIGLCSSQLVQPRRLIERFLGLHENSNRLIAQEASMSLYADISEANKYPSRDDLHKRVFNKDGNVSVCDRKMAEFVHLEKFPWNFAASQVQLQHSVNRFCSSREILLKFCGLSGSTTTQCQSLWIWSLFCPRWKEICVYIIHPRHASFWSLSRCWAIPEPGQYPSQGNTRAQKNSM